MSKARRGGRFSPSVALGAAIRARRKELGMSQELLASEADVDRTYVGGLERGQRNPTLKVLWRLAEALDLTPTELVARIEDGS